ncbi:MAG TPA: amino acid ABC transporter permease [Ktedonobacterales bacterium]
MNPIQSFLRSYDGAAVTHNVFSSLILQGVVITIVLAVLAQLTGTILGLIVYFMRRARFRPLGWVAEVYIWFFRGTPLLVQILFVYLAMPYLSLARPLRNADIFSVFGFSGVYTDSFVAGFLALALNEGAYMAEIVRAGIDSIDPGQMEAAKTLGMTYWLGMRRIVLPQAMRVILPPLGNEFNGMLKNTSLVSVISLYDLLGAAEAIGSPTFRTLELLTVACIWYLLMTTVWTIIQSWLERRFNASTRDPGSGKSVWDLLLSRDTYAWPILRRSGVGGVASR